MDTTSVLRVILSVLLVPALILNIVFLVFGIRHKIGKPLCSHLFRSQAVIDSLQMLLNLLTFQYFEFFPLPSQSLSDSLWLAYCKLAYSEIFHWSLVCMSVYNLACLSVERCSCLAAYNWYQNNQRLPAGGFIAAVLSAPFIVQVPYCLLVTVLVKSPESSLVPVNDTSMNTTTESGVRKHCDFSEEDQPMRMGFGISYVILFWVLPTALSIAMYVVILRKFLRSKRKQMDMCGSGRRMDGPTKWLTLMTCITSGAFVLLFAMDSITYLLYCIGVPMEKRGAYDSVDSFLLSLNSAVNPLLYLIFMPKFRNFVTCANHREQWRQRRYCDDAQGRSATATSESSGGVVAKEPNQN